MKILIIGAGKIGSAIASLLADTEDYEVTLADHQFTQAMTHQAIHRVKLDVTNPYDCNELLHTQKFDTVVSCLPYYLSLPVAELAKKYDLHYFDLTEDVATTHAIMALAANSAKAFVPQCGLAPGFINIAAHHLMRALDSLESIKLRVGALPIHSSNALHYALTWSVDGLINGYGNPCQAIIDGKLTELSPLSDLETLVLDGIHYEAFNTSGGIGTLPHTYAGKVKNLEYKTLRYPGHCKLIKFLMNELKLNHDRKTLKTILEHAIPTTHQDVVVTYVSVNGHKKGIFSETNVLKKIYPVIHKKQSFTAIQIATASSLCAILDMVLMDKSTVYRGFVRQEQFSLEQFLSNRFGKYYA